jgi:hypothetical protein
MSIPQPSPMMLFGVVALAPDDVWAVGHTYLGGAHWIPLVLHWDGEAWTTATIPAFPLGGQVGDVVAHSPTDVTAVGFAGEGSFAETLVLQWDGASWTRPATPSPGTGPEALRSSGSGRGHRVGGRLPVPAEPVRQPDAHAGG